MGLVYREESVLGRVVSTRGYVNGPFRIVTTASVIGYSVVFDAGVPIEEGYVVKTLTYWSVLSVDRME